MDNVLTHELRGKLRSEGKDGKTNIKFGINRRTDRRNVGNFSHRQTNQSQPKSVSHSDSYGKTHQLMFN